MNDNLGIQVLEPGRYAGVSLHCFPCEYLIACNAGHGQEAGSSVAGGAVCADFELAVTETTVDEVIVAVRGEIDVATAGRFREVIDEAVVPGRRLVIDLAGTSFIDSTGLGVLAQTHARLADSSGAVIIRSASASTRKLLNISGLDRVLTIEVGDGHDNGSGSHDRGIRH